MQNPYKSPDSLQSVSKETSEATAGRPKSIWLFLIVCGIYAVISVVGLFKVLAYVATHGSEVTGYAVLAGAIALKVAFLSLTAGPVIGLFYRRQWGRWLALVALIGVIGFSVLGADSTRYASDAERAGGLFARFVLIPAVMLWWAYAIAFSAKSKSYFHRA
jgi:hypothetical protein